MMPRFDDEVPVFGGATATKPAKSRPVFAGFGSVAAYRHLASRRAAERAEAERLSLEAATFRHIVTQRLAAFFGSRSTGLGGRRRELTEQEWAALRQPARTEPSPRPILAGFGSAEAYQRIAAQLSAERAWRERMLAMQALWSQYTPVTISAPGEELPPPPTPPAPPAPGYGFSPFFLGGGGRGGRPREPVWVQQLTTWRNVLA